uniref:Subtilisin-like protease fibronectin type-III domain-containing protein n=1 Tax=Nelumbo nucifera TaxID=4432 RepID=A0A822YXJ2_NELNU|nr:TPA_asm: hypothetical protein HUJ06_006535 [Nelumbo nucifera]
MQLTVNEAIEPVAGVFRRTVTNVGLAGSIYNATINAAPGVEITVEPMSLSFSSIVEKQSFTVSVKAKPKNDQSFTVSVKENPRSIASLYRSTFPHVHFRFAAALHDLEIDCWVMKSFFY